MKLLTNLVLVVVGINILLNLHDPILIGSVVVGAGIALVFELSKSKKRVKQ